MNVSNPRTIRWLGPNLEKAKRVYEAEQERAKKVFLKKYPHAKVDEFEFRASVNDQGNLVQQAVVYYVGDGTKLLANYISGIASDSWPITSRTFREKYSSALYSGPTIIWNPKSKVQPFVRSEATFPFDPLRFKIFVSKDQSFTSNFPLISTHWINQEESKNILKAKFNKSQNLGSLLQLGCLGLLTFYSFWSM